MTTARGDIGSVPLDAIRPMPCLVDADPCAPWGTEVEDIGVGPDIASLTERTNTALIMGVGALIVSVLIAVGAILVGVFLLRTQRDRHLSPAGAVVRRLDNEVPGLPPDAVPVHLGYPSPSAATADRPLAHWG